MSEYKELSNQIQKAFINRTDPNILELYIKAKAALNVMGLYDKYKSSIQKYCSAEKYLEINKIVDDRYWLLKICDEANIPLNPQ